MYNNLCQLGPPNELAEGCSFDNNISSQLGEPDEHAEGQSLDYDKSSKLGAPDDLAEGHSIDNHESSQLGAPDELAEDHSLDNQNSSQLGTAEYKRLFAFQAAGPKVSREMSFISSTIYILRDLNSSTCLWILIRMKKTLMSTPKDHASLGQLNAGVLVHFLKLMNG